MSRIVSLHTFDTPRDSGRRRRVAGGYTLVELMVVVIIISVLSAIALSSTAKRNTATGAQGLAREIYALANQARMTASSSDTQVLLSLRWPGEAALAGGQNPTATLQMAPGIGNQVYAVNQFGSVIAQIIALQQAQITGVDAGPSMNTVAPMANRNQTINVIFYPNGTATIPGSATAGATIFVADNNMGNRQRVLIYGRTSFVKVLDR